MFTPERWRQLKELLAPALEMGPAERMAYVERVSAGDPLLRNELEGLLAANRDAGTTFLQEAAPFHQLEDDSSLDSRPAIGLRVGAYLIVEEIGSGGMGAVYRAFRADDEYRKQVAIKLVRAGQDSKTVVQRFKNERQILATLDHANIARLLDGGTTGDGVPYFVMELIEGQPIDQYCDAHKRPIAERLELFRSVCSAVQYSHQNLIIHRDLKPGNILVTPEGVPKLLDFGIAKILDPANFPASRQFTTGFMRILTPEYASPEQVRGETITTASDVYSLGVVLYVLLTGHHPYVLESHSPQDVAKAVCDAEPMKPSTVVRRYENVIGSDGSQLAPTPQPVSSARSVRPEKLRRQLAGDLDNIVLMAMRKEPQRRYASVAHFSEDIRRHLAGLPVSARKDTFVYRSTKFLKRNKLLVAAILVSAGLLVAVLALATAFWLGRGRRGSAGTTAQPSSGETLALGPTRTQCTSPPDGMVGWWPGDGNANCVISGYNGTLEGGATFAPGMVRQAFSFNGTDAWVDVPNNNNLNPGTSDFTVDFWMNTSSVPSIAEYFLAKRDVCSFASFWSIQMQSAGKVTAELDDESFTNYNVIFGTAVVNDGKWHHIALVRQGVTATLYIDGSRNGTGSTPAITNIVNSADVLFANSPCVPGNGSQFYQGLIDEVEYFNRALSPVEIAGIVAAGSAGTCKPGEARRGIPESVTILDMIDRPGGAAKVAEKLAAARRSDPKATLFPEAVVNSMGYKYLDAGKTKEAVEIMKLNAMAYPDSPNVYDSLGDAYLADGHKDLARQNWRKALELLPSDTVGPPARRDVIKQRVTKQSAEQKLKDLGETQR